MKRNYTLFLKDILQAIADIDSYVGSMDYNAFLSDKKTRSDVLWSIDIIGEASKNIPQSVRDEYKELLWQDMARMGVIISLFLFWTKGDRLL
ncbi:MAG: DUF86 domain-containing protein [Nitrospirae bacterium]|nr:DUF86 domain-containing protein [Nitrospirota bacterium]